MEADKACETSGLPHFLYNQLKDDGGVVSPTRRPPVIRKISNTNCYWMFRPTKAYIAAERNGSIGNRSDVIRNRIIDLSARSIVPEPNTLPRVPLYIW